MRSNLTPSLVASVTFSPTIGIAAARIDKLGLDIRSFREPLKRAVKDVMIPSIRKNFDDGGRPSWTPLSDATLKLRQSRNISGSNPLVATGALRAGATQQNIWTITPVSAIVNDLPEKVWYGKVHQGGYQGTSMASLLKKHGGDMRASSKALDSMLNKALAAGTTLTGKGGTASIPARPFLDIQPEDEEKIIGVFELWLGARLEAAWPKGL